jgi:hypothetical protein
MLFYNNFLASNQLSGTRTAFQLRVGFLAENFYFFAKIGIRNFLFTFGKAPYKILA